LVIAPKEPRAPSELSALLVTARPASVNDATYFDVAEAAAAAAASEIAERMPLPPGESLKLEELDWSQMGGVSAGDIEFMLQYRASRAWYRYVLNGGLTPEAARIIGEIASWPAFRGPGNEAGEMARKIAAALVRGDDTPLHAHVRANCGPRPNTG
jgi:hypothetical protein